MALSFAAYAAWDQGWTADERMHLGWSMRFVDGGVTERDSAPRYDSKTPIHVPNALLAAAFESDDDKDDDENNRDAFRFAARFPQIVWLLVTYVAVGGLARRLGGPMAARLAVLFAALDPNLIAHASVVTTDMPLAAATVLALWAAVTYRQTPSFRLAIALGLGLGLALTAKFSAVLLVPLALGLAFLPSTRPAKALFVDVALCLFAAWIGLAVSYGFSGLFKPLGSSTWKSSLFQSVAASAASLPSPLPLPFLEGVDRSRWRDHTVDWIVVTLGHPTHHPVPYFFAVGWTLKTPLALMAISLAALPWLLRQAKTRGDLAWLLFHQAVNFCFFSFAFRTQLGYRFILMLVPITSVLIALFVATRERWAVPLAGVATIAALVEILPYWGDPLAFSNALVQPKKKAYLFLANSDIDWLQNRDRWQIARAKGSLPDNGALNPADLRLGLNVVSTSWMAGVIPGDPFRWARENLKPKAIAGWTHHYFDVTEEQYDKFLTQARTLSPSAEGESVCGLSHEAEMDPPGKRTAFENSTQPSGLRTTILCVATRKGADLTAATNGGRFELVPTARPELRTYLPPGQSVMFRLEPGVHVFALLETPYRREFLQYVLDASFSAERHGALIRILRIDKKDLPAGSSLARWFEPEKAINLP